MVSTERFHANSKLLRGHFESKFSGCVRPILAYSNISNQVTSVIGSSILISSGPYTFLVTAGHVYKEIRQDGSKVYALNDRSLAERVCNTPTYGTDTDIVFFDVTPRNQFRKHRYPLLRDVSHVRHDDIVYMMGFPSSKNKENRKTFSDLSIACIQTTIDTRHAQIGTNELDSSVETTRRGSRWFLNYDRKNFCDDYGTPIEMLIKPQGFSGGPVFIVGSYYDVVANVSIRDFQLLGVASFYEIAENKVYLNDIRAALNSLSKEYRGIPSFNDRVAVIR